MQLLSSYSRCARATATRTYPGRPSVRVVGCIGSTYLAQHLHYSTLLYYRLKEGRKPHTREMLIPYYGALTSMILGRQEVRVLNHATWRPTAELAHPLTVEPAEGAFPHAIHSAS